MTSKEKQYLSFSGRGLEEAITEMGYPHDFRDKWRRLEIEAHSQFCLIRRAYD